MKTTIGLVLSLLACTVQAQVKLRVATAGKLVGEARVSQRIVANGGKFVELRLQMNSPASHLTVTQQSTFDAKGAPVRKVMDVVDPTSHSKQQVIATFDAEGANLVIEKDGLRSTKKVSLLANAPRANASELWFAKTKPEIGAKSKAYVFDLNTLEWNLVETVYIGLASTDGFDGAHRIKMTYPDHTVEAFLDDDGLPIRITDSRGPHMARTKTQ